VAEDYSPLASFKNCNGHLSSISSKEFLDYLRKSWLLNKNFVRPKNLKGVAVEEPCSLPSIQTAIVCRGDHLNWQLDCLDLRKQNSNNHQPDATVFQFIILTVIYSSTCFGSFPAHHQELNDCGGSLWFYLCIMVTVVLCLWSGRLAGRLVNCCIWLVIYLNCTMMHRLPNLKFKKILFHTNTCLYRSGIRVKTLLVNEEKGKGSSPGQKKICSGPPSNREPVKSL